MMYQTQPPPTLPPQPSAPMSAPPRRGLRVAIVVIAMLALIGAVVSTAPSTISKALSTGYPRPELGPIQFSNGLTSQGNLYVPPNQAIQFSVTTRAGRDLTYQWDFGDGTSASGSTVTHSFQPDGNNGGNSSFNVSVRATDGVGQQASEEATVALVPPPTADFSIGYYPQCNYDSNSNTVTCDVSVDGSNSSTVDPNGLTYHWDWGDGASNNTNSSQTDHIYSFQYSYYYQTYTITLTVTDSFGQTSYPNQRQVSLYY